MIFSPFVHGYTPSGRPVSGIASVTRMAPVGCAEYAILMVGGERWIPSEIRPKNGGSGIGSGIELIDVLIESEDRGDVRRERGESIELRGVYERLEPFEMARRGSVNGEVVFMGPDDFMVGEVVGDSCLGDCVGVLGREGV